MLRRTRFGAIDLQTALAGIVMLAFCYAAWLTSIVFSATHGARSLLIAAATFAPIGIIHGVGVWFGGW
jgi:ABC-type arginine transport system permease subunit